MTSVRHTTIHGMYAFVISTILYSLLYVYAIFSHYLRAPWITCVWFWGRSYIIPNIDSVVLGGTAERGEWDTVVSLTETTRILHDIYEIFPSIKNSTVETVWVGLRPGRSAVRLDREQIPVMRADSVDSSRKIQGTQWVFNCYGHGGSGVTLAMGCAEDLVRNYFYPTFA